MYCNNTNCVKTTVTGVEWYTELQHVKTIAFNALEITLRAECIAFRGGLW